MTTPPSTLYAPPRRVSFVGDVYAGAVRGDYAEYLGLAGRATQIVCSFIPVVGTICALRDFLADRHNGDRMGAFLNLLGLIPFLGGFPKTAAVIRGVRHVGKVAHATQQMRNQKQQQ